jgi:outer membrane beta-barrel protein
VHLFHSHKRRSALASALFWVMGVLLFAPLASQAQEAGRLLAVQQRKFRLTHELTLAGMFEPQDAFSKGLAPEAAYTFHLDDTFSWEVLRGGYVAQFDTGLREQLQRDFGVSPTANPVLQWYATSALEWSPLYGKFALSNAKVIHLEAFLTGGGALGRYTDNAMQFGPLAGVGFRVYLSEVVSLRFDARDAVFIHKKATGGAPINQALFLSLGLSFSLGSAE